MRTDVEVVVGHNIARLGCSRSVVGPCIACSLRSRVAPEILCFAPLSIVMKHDHGVVGIDEMALTEETKQVQITRFTYIGSSRDIVRSVWESSAVCTI